MGLTMTRDLTAAQAEQLLALLERGATTALRACDIEELSFGSPDVLAILARAGLVAHYAGQRNAWWHLTGAGEAEARLIVQRRMHG